jgi:photosystem II CP43 chlorophyll apoprotein
VHASVIIFWSGSIAVFELSHFVEEKPLYEQGFILLPHLGTLGFSIGGGGEITSVYSYFLTSVSHLFSSTVLSVGGIYHAVFGPERLEETTDAHIFPYQYQDRFRITAILGAHLGTIGSGALLFWVEGVYFGVYDTFASGGGDCRLVAHTRV